MGLGNLADPGSTGAFAGDRALRVQRVETALTDALRIQPDPIAVRVGAPVTFVVTNTGVTDPRVAAPDAGTALAGDVGEALLAPLDEQAAIKKDTALMAMNRPARQSRGA